MKFASAFRIPLATALLVGASSVAIAQTGPVTDAVKPGQNPKTSTDSSLPAAPSTTRTAPSTGSITTGSTTRSEESEPLVEETLPSEQPKTTTDSSQ